MNFKKSVYRLNSKEIFKKGDWFYLDFGGIPIKLEPQDVINFKLGVKVKKLESVYNCSIMAKISRIDKLELYYKEWIEI